MKDTILAQAMILAARRGFQNVLRQDIAVAAKVATGTVNYHFKTMRKLRAAMVEHAIETKNLTVLAGAIAAQHPLALKAPPELKKAAARQLAAQV